MYICKDFILQDPAQFCSSINLVCLCDLEIPTELTSCDMLNLILIKKPVSVNTLYARIQNIILTSSDEGYIPQKLLDAACSGNLQTIADTACSLLGNPIIIYDLGFQILAFSQNLRPENEIYKMAGQDEQMIQQTMAAFFQVKALDTMREKGSSYFWKCYGHDKPLPEDTILIHAPIMLDKVIIGYAVVMKGYVDWDESDLILTDKICKIISLEMKNNYFNKNIKGMLHEHFLRDMLENSIEKREFIEARISTLNLKLNKNIYMAVIQSVNPTHLNSQLHPILKELGKIFKNSIFAVYTDHIVLIHHNNENQELTGQEQERLNTYLNACDMAAGFSMCFHDPCQIKRHYQQAKDALDIGLSLQKPGKVFFFQQLSIYRLFELGNKTTDITDYLHPAVFCLVNYDKENHTEFMKTLYYYIINLKALLKTKEILYIHRNTLVYRINKIQEITNIDLHDGETFFQLYISFKGLEFIAHRTNNKISFF
ncbi:PucR family transcriptional regulator [Bacillus sp. 1NLA3E]|uniref:PucR family transcriptional regulator n=1 Tax=Bacillus sp. 1NLA3E TaxID=666686 RepID=UPI0016515D80|nr:helix-turn-helix domain-containing protein [Bacillus sp. 1NLA3E]